MGANLYKKGTRILVEVLHLEAEALKRTAEKIQPESDQKIINIFQKLIDEESNLYFCGVGKSGHIARKLAATFSSLGLPSYFLHPVEALHGDLGQMKKEDAIVFISKSGNTEEIIKLLPFLPTPKEMRMGLIGNIESYLGRNLEVALDCSVEKEACINNQAPTTSSTVALAMGDAMAVLFETISGIDSEKFARNHPGGKLGKSLRLKVHDLMWPKEQSPILTSKQTLQEAILEMTKFPAGACAILGEKEEFVGILVEGDIRRYFASGKTSLEIPLESLINENPVVISSDKKAYDALKLMKKKEKPISLLPVVDNKDFRGFIRFHDLLKEGF